MATSGKVTLLNFFSSKQAPAQSKPEPGPQLTSSVHKEAQSDKSKRETEPKRQADKKPSPVVVQPHPPTPQEIQPTATRQLSESKELAKGGKTAPKKGKPGSSTRDMSRTIGKNSSKTLDSLERGMEDLLDPQPNRALRSSTDRKKSPEVHAKQNQPEKLNFEEIEGMLEHSETADLVSKPEPVVRSTSRKQTRGSASIEPAPEQIPTPPAEAPVKAQATTSVPPKKTPEAKKPAAPSRRAGMEIMEDSLPTPNRRRTNDIVSQHSKPAEKPAPADPYKAVENNTPVPAQPSLAPGKRVSPSGTRSRELNKKPQRVSEEKPVEPPAPQPVREQPKPAEVSKAKGRNALLQNTVVAPLFTPDQAEKIAEAEAQLPQPIADANTTSKSKDKKAKPRRGGREGLLPPPTPAPTPKEKTDSTPALEQTAGRTNPEASRIVAEKDKPQPLGEAPTFHGLLTAASDPSPEKTQQPEPPRVKISPAEQGADLVRSIEEEIKSGVRNNLVKRDYKREAMKELGMITSNVNSPEEKPVSKVKVNIPDEHPELAKPTGMSSWSQIFKQPVSKETEMNTKSQPALGDGKIPLSSLRVGTWNINGIRACSAKGLVQFIKSQNLDILCFNEMKIDEADFYSEKHDAMFPPEYFQYWNFCNSKKGYSGTGVISKFKPKSVFKGLGDPRLDDEGRLVTLEFQDFYLVACYVPNASQLLRRLTFRTKEWDPALLKYINTLRATKPTLLIGDLNVAPTDVDTCDPRKFKDMAGTTIEERNNFKLMLDNGWVDSFRHLNGNLPAFSFFNYSNKGNKRRSGLRLDFVMAGVEDVSAVRDVTILEDIGGSDHVPVTSIIDVDKWRRHAHKRKVVWGTRASDDAKSKSKIQGETLPDQQTSKSANDVKIVGEDPKGAQHMRPQSSAQQRRPDKGGRDDDIPTYGEPSRFGGDSNSEPLARRQQLLGSTSQDSYRGKMSSGWETKERPSRPSRRNNGEGSNEASPINLIEKMNAHLQQSTGKQKSTSRK